MKEIYWNESTAKNAPNIYNLIAKIEDKRKGKKRNSDNVIIILTYKSKEQTKEFIYTLTKQNFKDYDIILIYGPGDEIIDLPKNLNVVHIFRKEDIGCAGGFYLGEKYAYEAEYEKFIHIESDVRFVNNDTLKKIIETSNEYDIVMPTVFTPDLFIKGRGMHQATCFNRKVIEKVGFTLYPLYFGAEDGEYESRIKTVGSAILIKDYVTHPTKSPILVGPYKAYYFTRNDLFVDSLIGTKVLIQASYRIWEIIFLFLNKNKGYKTKLLGIKDFLKLKLGRITELKDEGECLIMEDEKIKDRIKKDNNIVFSCRMNHDDLKPIVPPLLKNIPRINIKSKGDLGIKKILTFFSEYFSNINKVYNKTVITNHANYFDYSFYSLVSKELILYENSKWYNRKFKFKDRIAALLSYSLIPLVILVSLIIVLYSKIFIYPKKKYTYSYGW